MNDCRRGQKGEAEKCERKKKNTTIKTIFSLFLTDFKD
jgi:hypothetical protein